MILILKPRKEASISYKIDDNVNTAIEEDERYTYEEEQRQIDVQINPTKALSVWIKQ